MNFLMSLTLISFILISCPPWSANADLIEDVCKDTADKSRCLSLLRDDPQAASAKDNRDISKSALELAIKKATESKKILTDLIEAKMKDPTPENYAFNFNSCQSVIGSFNTALGELNDDIQSSNYDSKTAGDDVDNCQKELESHGIQIPDISSRNKDLMLLSEIAFQATKGDPHASSAKSYRELAKFTLEICLRKAIESQNFIKGLLKAKENASVRYCAFESYAAVVGSFSSAYGELDEDIDTANYDSKIAGDDADECQRELESHGIQIPEIFSRNKDMKLLSSIAYSVTNLVS
ncbi:pectinesterase inhibitor [Senna tora]|uniref:Pectinesterase inhibitor n=1 Tax=Senna tora TaxID=362788 RepID=A0A834SGV4_9FABA|nr:pectinesterase inhibitor [Senna tora]